LSKEAAVSLSKNSIHQGDCVELLQRSDAASVDLVFADPPFNIGYEYDVYDDAKQAPDYLDWCQQWIAGVHRVLRSNGTFWLAIGDEYAAELKITAQQAGFHCRSWVIWYYTFGVNCVNGFSRSHTHLFHFVKEPKDFTFNRPNPQIRVKSARELVYADNRANPNGRLPDNTWIIRPQDAPLSFSPAHDTWYFARVAGTFKEREGFHGCQMPEQLLARIIRTSSRPQDLVLDPFGGSGTTMCVAKKLGRQWMGFELSADYVSYIDERLGKAGVGDPIDGPEDPIQSAPSTAKGKKRKKAFNEETERAVIEAYQKAGCGYPADYILYDKDINKEYVSECLQRGLRGSAFIWNHYMLHLRKAGKLPRSTRRPVRITSEEMNRYGFASEVAWRLLAIDYRKTLDDILCSPEFAAEFDRLAAEFGPMDIPVTSCEYRRAAVTIRKRTKPARESAAKEFGNWSKKKLTPISIDDCRNSKTLDIPGAFVLRHDGAGIYAYESKNIREQIEIVLDNPSWRGLEPDSIVYAQNDQSFVAKYALKSALAQRESPLLNCRLWVSDSELPECTSG
jgi:site-specific DNA-methyltransferase (adenine-specific)